MKKKKEGRKDNFKDWSYSKRHMLLNIMTTNSILLAENCATEVFCITN